MQYCGVQITIVTYLLFDGGFWRVGVESWQQDGSNKKQRGCYKIAVVEF